MHCPYCVSEIPDEALVCSVCRRDLYVVKPLLERIAALEAELAARPLAEAASEEKVAVGDVLSDLPAVNNAKPRSLGRALACWLLPLLLLVLGHWLIIFVYDAKVLYLRLLALVLPLPFGFLFVRYARSPFLLNLLPAALMAFAAVWAMSGVTALIDKVPVLPQNMSELREFIEFAASIGLSFTTGLWLAAWLQRWSAEKTLALARQRGLGGLNGQKVSESLTKLNDIGSAVVAAATTAFSIYTGLKGVLG